MDAAPLVVVDNVDGKHWYTSIQKIQETSLEACAEDCEKLVIRARRHPPPLLPMVAVGQNLPRTRRRCSWDAGVTDSSAERREKIGLEVRNQSTSCTGSAIEVVMPYMF